MKRVLGVCMAAMLVLSGCGTAQTEEVPELINAVGVDMDTAVVEKRDLSGVMSYAAQVVPTIESMSFLSSGNIENLYVSIGDHVKKGKVLATIYGGSSATKSMREEIQAMKETNEDLNRQSQYDIDMLQENLSNLKKSYKNAKNSGEKKQIKAQIISQEQDIIIAKEKLKQQKETQNLEIKQKERKLAAANSKVKNTKLVSTIDGEVVSTCGGTGYMIQGGTVAVRVANMEKPRLKTTYVSSSILAKASNYVALIDGKEYAVEAEEQEVSRQDIEMGNFPANTWFNFVDKDVSVKVGKSAAIELYSDSVKDALVVPSNAVFRSGEESYVYVVSGDAKTKTIVTTGTKTDAYTQIVTGVNEGDVVYVED